MSVYLEHVIVGDVFFLVEVTVNWVKKARGIYLGPQFIHHLLLKCVVYS